ncbi:NAD-dependent epimerase/dehydratase family protein [Yinghuangia aomiensis]
MRRIRSGEPPVIDGRGDQSMDFVHVTDIARAVVAALESGATACRSTSAPASTPPSRSSRRSSSPPSAPRWNTSSTRATCSSRAAPRTSPERARSSARGPTVPVEKGMADLARVRLTRRPAAPDPGEEHPPRPCVSPSSTTSFRPGVPAAVHTSPRPSPRYAERGHQVVVPDRRLPRSPPTKSSTAWTSTASRRS